MDHRAAVAALLVLATACGGGKNAGRRGDAEKPCDGLLKPADAAAALPPGVPAGVDGATFYELQTQGATKRYFAHWPGTDLVGTRDRIRSTYQAAGLTIEGSDAEAGAEAEFQWSGAAQEGSVQVRPLCEGQLQLRYRVGPR